LGTSAPVYGPTITTGGNNYQGHIWQGQSQYSGHPITAGQLDLYYTGGTPSSTVFGDISATPTGYSTFNTGGVGGVTDSLSLGSKAMYGTAAMPSNQPPYADLTSATAATINALRQAFQIQRLLERDARGGTRYVEIIRSHFGVVSPDFRLQRPEYLGGGTAMINIAPVPQTSATGASGTTTPAGSLSAMGTFSHSGIGFNHSFVEHGVILGLMSVRSDYSYQQSLDKMWTRQTRYDYYWPALSHLGEQAVLNQEIWYQGVAGTGSTQDQGVFGYQERYAEYRYKQSLITGYFRSTAPTPLDNWHLAQKFTTLPVLNNLFIEENPPISRIVAVSSQPNFLFDCVMDLRCARPMPVYSVPGFIDHF